jgi:hypothetical protein
MVGSVSGFFELLTAFTQLRENSLIAFSTASLVCPVRF